jgi:DNA-binding MarR family transcriptional regulator
VPKSADTGGPPAPQISSAMAEGEAELLERVFEAWRELRRGAVRKLNKDFYGRWPDALDPSQMDVLEMIACRPSWRMAKLAQALHLDPSTVTRSIDRLAGLGLVARVATVGDGRGVQVRATASGRKLCRKVPARRMAVMQEVLQEMPLQERQELARLLEKMVDGVRSYARKLDTAEDADDWTSARWQEV